MSTFYQSPSYDAAPEQTKTPAKGKRQLKTEAAPGAPVKKASNLAGPGTFGFSPRIPIIEEIESDDDSVVEELGTQIIPDEPFGALEQGILISLGPVSDIYKPYKAISMPFSKDSSFEEAVRAIDMGTIVDEKGDKWFCIVTNRIYTDRNTDFTVIYKMYNKSNSDKARDEFAKQRQIDNGYLTANGSPVSKWSTRK